MSDTDQPHRLRTPEELLRAPLGELAHMFLFNPGWRERYGTRADDTRLREHTGKGAYEQTETSDPEAVALAGEVSKHIEAYIAIDWVNELEKAMMALIGEDATLSNAARNLTQAAFNAGFRVGVTSQNSYKTLKDAAGREQNRQLATQRRREKGDETRHQVRGQARIFMAQKGNAKLTMTACANELAGTGDAARIRRIISPLFPKGPDGKRRYVGDNPPEDPADPSERPVNPPD